MLNRDSIHLQMKDLTTCSTQHLTELKELMELYPYASSLVTLYLKSLANDQDLRLNSQLEKYAYQIPNRALLYGFLTEKPIEKHKEEEQLSLLPEEKIGDQRTEEFVPMDDVEMEIHEEPILNKDDVLHLLPEMEEGEEEAPLNIPHHVDTNSEVEELIQSAVIGSSYLQMAYPESQEEIEEEDLSIYAQDAENSLDEPTSSMGAVSNEPKSFTDWLKMGEILDGKHEEEIEEDKKPSFYQFEKPKKEFYSPLKKAKESVSENAMPVSETLAQIFALQGNINKAIQVYEQLSLSFPEKKSFFASQIRNLKRKLNS